MAYHATGTMGSKLIFMPTDVKIIENALPISLINDVVNHAKQQSLVRTNHTSWGPEVVGVSGPLYIIDLQGEFKQRIQDQLILMLPEQELANKSMAVSYNMSGRYSFIPWHDDGQYLFSITIYLNPEWDENWAGHFIYKKKDSDELIALLPKFNRAVCFEPPLQHYVAMPNVNAPLRCTLQIFFSAKESSAA